MLNLILDRSGLFLATHFGVRCSAVGPKVELAVSVSRWISGKISWSGSSSDPVYFVPDDPGQSQMRLTPNAPSNPALRYPPSNVYRLGRPYHRLSAFRSCRP